MDRMSSAESKSDNYEKYGMGIAFLAAIGLYVGSFATTAQFVGSKDDWNVIQPAIWRIFGYSVGGAFMLYIAYLFYFMQDSVNVNYFLMGMSFITLALSFSAVAIASISKV